MTGSVDLAEVARERELFVRLLALSDGTSVEATVQQALDIVVELTGAACGYLRVGGLGPDPAEGSTWTASSALSAEGVADVEAMISTGIVMAALASGEAVETASAVQDPRFRDRQSVRGARIAAVLCLPLAGSPPLGALYLQRSSGAGPFPARAQAIAALFARHVGPVLRGVLARASRADEDPTRPLRDGLACADLVGRSHAVAAVLGQLRMFAPLDITVLLTGPSGSGKSQLARLFHDNSRRRAGPFVAVNCAAIPETLVESELFGAEVGAHSTASRRIHGKVAAAQGGTLLLDEVGELAPSAQAKLLDLLQSGTYWPLGARGPARFDGRVIAATNVALEEAVAHGRFRPDLYYRLAVVCVRVPGLDERREDVPRLLEHFVRAAVERHRLPAVEVDPAAGSVAAFSPWPGHIRQLAHAAETAAVRAAAAGRSAITVEDLFPTEPVPQCGPAGELSYREATRRFQQELVTQTLALTDGNVTAAAGRLGLTRSHVHALLRSFQRDDA